MKKLFTLVAAACLALTMGAQVQQYNVAEAIAANLAEDTEIEVRGVVTKIEFKGKNFAKYGSANIYVADATGAEGAFEFYNCYSLAADTFKTSDPAFDATSTAWVQFNSISDANGATVHVGDTVIAHGNYTLYNNTVYELKQACYLTSIIESAATPIVDPEPVLEAISVADAITATMALDSAATSTEDYLVEGYVVNAGDFSWGSKQQIFFLADDATNTANQQFEAYYCTAMENNAALPVLNGDKVQLKGKLTKYYDKNKAAYLPEIKNGTATFISKVEGDRSQPTGDQITVAQALTYGASVAQGATSTETYTIVGYVTAYDGKNEDGGWEQYGNQIFWIADTQGSTAKSNADGGFEVYQGVAAEKVNIGDKISVLTKIKNYNGLLESEQRAPVTILEKAGEVVEDADVVFVMEDFVGLGTASTGSEVTVTKDGVTFHCDKAYGDGQYGVRCYQGGVITISAEEQIGKIVFEFGLEKTGGLDEEVVVNATSWTYTLPSQARMNKIKIYLGTAEEPEKPVYPENPEGVITCAEAAELAAAAADPDADNNKVEVQQVRVRGFVTFCYAASEGKQSAWIADDQKATAGTVQGYYLEVLEEVAKGDYVELDGTLVKYFKAGKDGKADEIILEVTNGTMTKIYPEAIENVVLTEKAQKVMIDGNIYIIRDGKMFNLQGAQVR